MNKNDIVRLVSMKTEIRQKDVKKILETALETIVAGAVVDGKTTIANFGTFYITDIAEHAGINPRTGDETVIPRRRTIKFRPGKGLKDALNRDIIIDNDD